MKAQSVSSLASLFLVEVVGADCRPCLNGLSIVSLSCSDYSRTVNINAWRKGLAGLLTCHLSGETVWYNDLVWSVAGREDHGLIRGRKFVPGSDTALLVLCCASYSLGSLQDCVQI